MPRFDIHFQALTAQEQADTFKFVGFTYNPAIGVSGFQMLINHWLKCFLTPRGTDPTDASYGTEFTNLVGSNVAVADAQDVVRIAIDECNTQVAAFQTNDTTLVPRERLASAVLTRFIPQPSAPGFDVYVELRNQAGERLTVNVPAAALGA